MENQFFSIIINNHKDLGENLVRTISLIPYSLLLLMFKQKQQEAANFISYAILYIFCFYLI